jgi:alkanesulfonate monooxygenase
MTAKFFWFLPTNGDSRSIVGASHASSHHTVPDGYREPSRRYLAEVARAADRLGYEGVLTPTGTWCEDAWLTAVALLSETERLKFLVAFRPGLVPPTLAAQQTATLQRFSDGRVLLNVVSGGDDSEQRRFGDWLGHDERYARTAEFLQIVQAVWAEESVDFTGEYNTIKDGRVSAPPNPLLQIYFGGSSAAALPVAAEFVDVYLTWGEPPQRKSSGCEHWPGPGAGISGSASGCTPSVVTRPRPPGRWPTNWSASSPRSRSPRRPRCTPVRSPRASGG